MRNISDSRGRSTINIYHCIEVTVENQSCVTTTKTHQVRTDESYAGLSNKGFSAAHIITIAGTTQHAHNGLYLGGPRVLISVTIRHKYLKHNYVKNANI